MGNWELGTGKEEEIECDGASFIELDTNECDGTSNECDGDSFIELASKLDKCK